MKTKNHFLIVCIFVLVNLSSSPMAFSAQKTYVKKSELLCDGTKVQIVTKCDDLDLEGSPQCDDQILTFVDSKSGKNIRTTAYGKPYDKQFDGTGTANAWQCVKGKKQTYITLWYSTGGNCEECEWQGILDLHGNRIATDINKKKRALFARKWKALGLPVLGPNDFTEIPLKKKE